MNIKHRKFPLDVGGTCTVKSYYKMTNFRSGIKETPSHSNWLRHINHNLMFESMITTLMPNCVINTTLEFVSISRMTNRSKLFLEWSKVDLYQERHNYKLCLTCIIFYIWFQPTNPPFILLNCCNERYYVIGDTRCLNENLHPPE